MKKLRGKAFNDYTVKELCVLLGASKQAFYKYDEDAAMKKLAQEEFARQYILEVREKAPGLGGEKIWEMYRREFGVDKAIGRDRFCDIYEAMGMKLKKKKRKIRTTDSTHGLPTYPNKIKQIIPERFGQIVVGDITYIPIVDPVTGEHDFCYLSLLMDSHSKVVVGHKVAPTLEGKHSIEALQQAHAFLVAHGADPHFTIHHTDRGVQYASFDYIEQLRLFGMAVSMTENGNPKDNPEAERINETVKNQMLKGRVFHTIGEVEKAVAEAIDFYNSRRPHDSLDGLTPIEAIGHTGRFTRRWKSYREDAIDALGELMEEVTDKKDGKEPPAA